MKKFNIWPAGIFVLLGLNVAIVATTVALATSTDSTVVESRPYEKSLHWDEEQRHQAASKALGWNCKVAVTAHDEARKQLVVSAMFLDNAGAPLVGLNASVVAFHHASSSKRSTIELVASADEPGLYVATFSSNVSAPLGMWRVVVAADLATAAAGGRPAFEQITDLMLSIRYSGESVAQ